MTRKLSPLWVVVALCAGTLALAAKSAEPAKQNQGDALRRVVELELTRGSAQDVLAYLGHPDPEVRRRAALALGRLQDWTVAEPLTKFLGDPDPAVRKTVAFALGELDPVMPLLVPQIKAGKKGSDPNVRGPAMARATAEKVLDARLHLEDRADVRQSLYAALGPLAIGAGLHHLQFGLEAGNAEAAWASRALGVHGHRRQADAVQDPAINAQLTKLLQAPSDDVRFGATYALFRLRSVEVAPLLERLATDGDPRVRLYAARALSGQAGAENGLRNALKDPDWRVRVEAIRALAAAPRPRGLTHQDDVAAIGEAGLTALRLLLAEPSLTVASNAHVVMAAAEALQKAPPGMAVSRLEALNTALAGGDAGPPPWQLRCAVARGLDVLHGNASRVITCGTPDEPAWRAQARALEVLSALPGGAGEKARRLAAFLRDKDPHVRVKAAGALAGLDAVQAPDAVNLLAEALADETDPGAAQEEAAGLKDHPASTHLPALRKALKRFSTQAGDGPEATVAVLDAIAACNGKAAVEDARPLLKHQSPRVRRAAHAALTTLGETPPPLPRLEPPLWPAEELPARATLRTQKGDVVIRFYRDDAPLTVTNFVKLARRGYYRQMVFHRVVSDFVVQGGDPRADGTGGPGYAIPCEYNPRPYERGVVGMALSGKDSGGSQFFITHSPQPHLDGQYTAFAEVESGMEVVDALLQDDALVDVMVD
ncbi:MAG: peptidylprolyl isomerase [Myxococcota bacterium]